MHASPMTMTLALCCSETLFPAVATAADVLLTLMVMHSSHLRLHCLMAQVIMLFVQTSITATPAALQPC